MAMVRTVKLNVKSSHSIVKSKKVEQEDILAEGYKTMAKENLEFAKKTFNLGSKAMLSNSDSERCQA
ncbi:MAG: hypothetical protein NTX46_03420 [Chloroflexi bacterium]|nr:hypothetical protein [Chloroflexota bacterium]